MTHVFISYIHEDSDKVQKLCNDLTSKGVSVWLDRDSIQPRRRWKNVIRDAIENGSFFIACFSEAYHNRTKTYMNEELMIAIEELRQYASERAWFIPVLLSKCEMPDINIGAGSVLSDIQAISLFENWDEGIQRMVEVIQPTPPEEVRWAEIMEEHYKRPSKPRCQSCGAAYSVDNMYICSKCGIDYCYKCIRSFEEVEPGGWKCECGGLLR